MSIDSYASSSAAAVKAAILFLIVIVGASRARAEGPAETGVGTHQSTENLVDHPVVRALYRMPLALVSYRRHFETEVGSNEVGTDSIHLALTAPIYRWTTGAVSVTSRYSYDVFQPGDDDYQMHQIALAVGFAQTLSERWMLTVGLMPNLASDFRELDTNTFFMEGRAELGWAYSDSLSFRFGVAAHSRFGMYLPVPMLGFAYQPQGSIFEFHALVPKLLRARFRTTDNIAIELFAGLDNFVWDVNEEHLKDRGRYMKIKAGVGLRLRLWNALLLRLSGSVIPFCRFESFGSSDDPLVKDYDGIADIAPFFEAELYVSPHE